MLACIGRRIAKGLLLGAFCLLATGCHERDSVTAPQERLADLEVRLTWEGAVNMDAWIIEPTGKGSGHGEAGETAQNAGNNDCGFGDACNPAACSALTCNTPEYIYIPAGLALPETTEPFHYYDVGISNWSAVTTPMFLTIKTSAETRQYRCIVDGPRVSYVARIKYPSGTIENQAGFVEAYCK
ncbi:hypothetical protein U14_02134 [Candidatus Moduliflexus flocculans]|uniref:Lipoprotein n=1 Tax=Candidatus Moduliflexus flocculans TaxID=1499966 RepID=A0A0S6VY53_9BACT|nr:hypothetical protein U14_02134 [Candidatus Moduliflexus flocculans]